MRGTVQASSQNSLIGSHLYSHVINETCHSERLGDKPKVDNTAKAIIPNILCQDHTLGI